MTKICSKCNRELPLEAFRKKKGCKYGIATICKECLNSVVNKPHYGEGITKVCSSCKQELPLEEFCRHIRMKDGVRARCKKCEAEYSAIYNKTEKGKARFVKFRKTEKAKKIQAAYRKTPKAKACKKRHEVTPKCKATRDAYRSSPEGAAKTKATNQKHKKSERHRQTVRAYNQRRKKIAGVRLEGAMRSSLSNGLKGKKNGRHWETLAGYTIKELMDHLENLFQPGMTWANYGEWHLDHVIPRAAFFYSDVEDIDFKRCWALENLQPLWKEENYKKHAKVTKPFQPTLDLMFKSPHALDKIN